MKKLRAVAAAAFMATGMTFTSVPVYATGIPVLDIANLAQAIQEVLSWYEQYSQMVDQYNKLQDQYNQLQTMTGKLDGVRSLGTILNDPSIVTALPQEMQNSVALVTSAYSSGQLSRISGLMSSYGVTAGNTSAQQMADSLAKMQDILASGQKRSVQVNSLASRVDSSADAKDSMDLLNRNVIEGTQVNNAVMQTLATIEANRQANELRAVAADEVKHQAYRTRKTSGFAALGY